MSEAIKLVPKAKASDEIRESTLGILRDVMTDVEAGNVKGVVVLVRLMDDDVRHCASPTISVTEEIGMFEVWKIQRSLRVLGLAS